MNLTWKSVQHPHAQMRFFAEELYKCENMREVNKKMQTQIRFNSMSKNNQRAQPAKENLMEEYEAGQQ